MAAVGWSRVTGQAKPPVDRDPLVVALARYVEALHRRYPDGPEQVGRERLAVGPNSANVVAMNAKHEAGAA